MSEWGAPISLLGLIVDIAGFYLIGRALWKHPDRRLFWGGGDKGAQIDRLGVFLVTFGFFLQFVGQLLAYLADRI
jgi:hypothetical protein